MHQSTVPMVPRTLEATVTFPSDMARAVVSSAKKKKRSYCRWKVEELAQLYGREDVRFDSGASSTGRGKST